MASLGGRGLGLFSSSSDDKSLIESSLGKWDIQQTIEVDLEASDLCEMTPEGSDLYLQETESPRSPIEKENQNW